MLPHPCEATDDGLGHHDEGARAGIVRRARVFASAMPEGWFFSHATAAILWSLPLPRRIVRTVWEAGGRGIDVAAPSPRRAPKAAGVRGHALLPELTGIRVVDGLAATSPATTWALLAPLLSVDELIEVGDAIVHIPRKRGMRRGEPDDALGTLEHLASALEAGRRVGARTLREALPQIRVGSASSGETRVRLACDRAGLPEPALDFDVLSRSGAPIGFTEIAFPEWRTLVEYEGDHHRVDRAQWDRDIEKHAACVAAGWDVVRLTARHVRPSPEPAIARIRAALVRAGWRG